MGFPTSRDRLAPGSCLVLMVLLGACASAPQGDGEEGESTPTAAPDRADDEGASAAGSEGDGASEAPDGPFEPKTSEELAASPEQLAEAEAARAYASDLSRIESALRDGDPDAARRIADRLLAAEALPPQFAGQLFSLRSTAIQRLAEEVVVDARIELDRTRVAIGEPLTGRYVVTNLGAAPLLIEAAGGRSGMNPRTRRHSLVRTDYRYTEYPMDGSTRIEDRSVVAELPERIALAPGEEAEWPLVMDTLELAPEAIFLRRIVVSGTLMPSKLTIGGEGVPLTVRFLPVLAEVYPRNWEHLAEAPFARMQQAVSLERPEHVPLCAALVAPDDRREVTDWLLALIARPSTAPPGAAVRVSACVALSLLTGEERRAHPQAWLERKR